MGRRNGAGADDEKGTRRRKRGNGERRARRGLRFNLVNYAWGTNFVQWYDDDLRFEFELHA